MLDLTKHQPFLAHLRAEHERLQLVVRKIEETLQGHSGQLAPQISRSLTTLRDELSRHFNEEDRGGCLEEAVCRCPGLAHEVTGVERQHPKLLLQLRRLISRVDAGESAGDECFIVDFQEFAGRLRDHQADENRILKEAFGFGIDDDV